MKQFNVRVYGVLVNDKDEILVSDLLFHGKEITKFPGGGLEFGEGTRECLVREFREELNIEVKVQEHIYTTDFFQLSAFHPDQQIISIYYKVTPVEPFSIDVVESPFLFTAEQLHLANETGEAEVFRYIPINIFSEKDVTLPIDKIVAEKIKNTLLH